MMHSTMFNDLPTPRGLLGCLLIVLAFFFTAGLVVGYFAK